MLPSIRIRREIPDALLQHARANAPNESCGLLVGRNSEITNFYPTKNASPTPTTNYEIPPQDLFRTMRQLRNANLDLLAIYHSHPASDNVPSSTDIARAYYPETPYIIVSPRASAPNPIRAFQIRNNTVTELSIQTISNGH